jgi:hypothetical protein
MNKNILFFLQLLLAQSSFAALKASLFTPQSKTEQVLFISSDDKFRYLKLTDEINLYYFDGIKTVFKSKHPFSHAELITSSSKVKAVLAVDLNPFDTMRLRKNKDLFVADFGNPKSDFALMAKGDFPKLHLNDAWLSFLDWDKRTLNLLFLPFTQKASYQLKVAHGKNPFFVPKAAMVDQESFFYTDGNEKGEEAVIYFNMTTKKFKIVHKVNRPENTIALCSMMERIFIAQWPAKSNEAAHIIELTNWKGSNFPSKKVIYENTLPHRGNIICRPELGTIAFLRAPSQSSKQQFSVTQVNSKDDSTEVLNGDYSFSSLFLMDQRLMAQEGGKFYVVTP